MPKTKLLPNLRRTGGGATSKETIKKDTPKRGSKGRTSLA
jgi:hypothetical protein